MNDKYKYEYFELAPRNPNINNLYYEKNSYNKALQEFFSVNRPLYDRYDNDTVHYKSDSHWVIGTIIDYINDDDEYLVEVKIDEQFKFINSEEYVIGFKLMTKGNPIIDKDGIKRYVIDKVLYATLINKDFL